MSEKEILSYQISLQKIIRSRLLKCGYADIDSFYNTSDLNKHLNAIAANRCFNDRIRPVHPLSMALVMRYLEFTRSEILTAIEQIGGTKYMILFEGPDNKRLESWEEGLLGVCNSIKDKPHVFDDIADFLTNLTNMHNVDASKDITRIRVPKKIIITRGGNNKRTMIRTPTKG